MVSGPELSVIMANAVLEDDIAGCEPADAASFSRRFRRPTLKDINVGSTPGRKVVSGLTLYKILARLIE